MKKLLTVFIPGLITLFVVFSIYLLDGLNEQSITTSVRATARISLVLFLLVFLAPLIKEFRNYIPTLSRALPLLTYRRQWGLAFGVVHLIHLETIIMMIMVVHSGDWRALGSFSELAPAIFIYLMLVLMMLTSNNFSVRLLGGKTWKYLHKFGLYILMIGFLQSVAPKFINALVNNNSAQSFELTVFYAITSIALVTIWMTRIGIWIKNKKAQTV